MSNLKAKMISGVSWASVAAISEKIIGLATIAFLARLLEPKDFGEVAVCIIAIGMVSTFTDIGFEAAIIQRTKDINKAASTAFFIVLLLASVNYALLFFLSKPIGIFYEDDTIGSIIKILSITIIIGSFTRIHNFLLSKELQFGKKAICEIIPNIVYGAVAIPLAFWGFKAWSIVYGEIAKAIVRSLLLLCISTWRPNLNFSLKIARELISYGKHVMFNNLLNFGSENIDNAIIGKFSGLTNLAFYKLSYNASAMPTQILYQIIGRVSIPAFSKLQGDQTSITRLYHRLLEYSSYIFVPVFFGLFLVAQDFINILYGPKWEAVVPLFKTLLVFGFFRVIRMFSDSLFLSTGRPSILPKLSLARIIIVVVLLFSVLQFGLLTFCIAISILEIAMVFIQFIFLKKYYDITILSQITALRISFLLSIPMTIVVLIVQNHLQFFCNNPPVMLIFQIMIGVLTYMLPLFFLNRKMIINFIDLKFNFLGSK